MRIRLSPVLVLAAAFGWCAQAQAQSPTNLAAAQLAASCANCHGSMGRTAEGSTLPPLAGAPKSQTLASLQAFKAGTRPATIMHQLARGYTDAQLELLADYFAGQRK